MGKAIKTLFIIIALFLLQPASVLAQELSVTPPPPVATPTPVDYSLPYPGILPGHPFYFLKVIRDSIVSFFIADPAKKTEYDLLQANKEVATAQALFAQKKDTLQVISALDSGLTFFQDATTKAGEAKKQGMDVQEPSQQLVLANLKYQEIVSGIIQDTNGGDKKLFVARLSILKQLEKKVKALHR